jgi:hypothetical protein
LGQSSKRSPDERPHPTPLGQLARYAAQVLPPGWSIQLTISRGSGDVTLIDPEETEVEYPSNRESVEEAFHDAIEYALEHGKGD